MRPSYPYDRDLHEPGSVADAGRCSFHAGGDGDTDGCTGEAVISYQDREEQWQSGCSRAFAELVERGDIEPLGQKA